MRAVVVAQQQIAASDDDSDRAQALGEAIDQDIDLSLAGILTIRAVDSEGRATSAVLDVEHFKQGSPGTDVVPPDAQIEAVRRGERFALRVDDKPRPDLEQYLELAFPLHRPSSQLGDELFGTKEPKQIGDTWAFSKSKVTERLLEQGYAVRETRITGDTRLQGTRLVGGVECLELMSKVHADRASIGALKDVKGAGAATLDSTIAMVVPIDTKLPVAVEESTTKAALDAGMKDERSAGKVGLTVTRYRKASYTPMPAPAR